MTALTVVGDAFAPLTPEPQTDICGGTSTEVGVRTGGMLEEGVMVSLILYVLDIPLKL